MSNKFTFFLSGPFSQWAVSPFTIVHGNTYNTCEQWMMWNKAILFQDFTVAYDILRTTDPKIQKQLGRSVRGFDDDIWMKYAYDVVLEGNRAKFTQNPDLGEKLKGTIGTTLVEAAPYDRRWGIGMSVSDPDIGDPTKWRGENLLGKALTQVRIELYGE